MSMHKTFVKGETAGKALSTKLPREIDEVYRQCFEGYLSEMARFAILEFMLREGHLDPQTAPLLPWRVWMRDAEGHEWVNWQAAPDSPTAEARALREAAGAEVVRVSRLRGKDEAG